MNLEKIVLLVYKIFFGGSMIIFTGMTTLWIIMYGNEIQDERTWYFLGIVYLMNIIVSLLLYGGYIALKKSILK